MSKWVEGTVLDNRHWTKDLYSLRISAEVDPFVAGQFTRLALEIDGSPLGRPYSYVNAPHQDTLEFYSIVVPGGPLSPRLARLRAGDRVLVARRASGLLTLDQIGDAAALYLMATGTGIGPFLSILGDGEVWRRFGRIALLHGVRTQAELSYRETIQTLVAAHPGQLHYQPFVSREPGPGALPGRITAALRDGSLERACAMALQPGATQVMLCGNPAMVAETSELLLARGLRLNKRKDPGDVTIENYWKA